MDFYNPVLSCRFLQTEINPLQPSKMKTKPKHRPVTFSSPILLPAPLAYCFVSKEKEEKEKKYQEHLQYLQDSSPSLFEFGAKFPSLSVEDHVSLSAYQGVFEFTVHRMNSQMSVSSGNSSR